MGEINQSDPPGKIVRRRRKELGLSQATVSSAIKIDRTSLSRFEGGEPSRLSRGTVLMLATYLGLDARELDPTLEGIYARVPDPPSGRIVLTWLPDGREWCAEGAENLDGVSDRELGSWLRNLIATGVSVVIPAVPGS